MLLISLLLSAQSPATPPPPANAEPDRRVCKSLRATGSRLSRVRECRTAREWEEIARGQREFRDRNRRTGGGDGPSGAN